MKSGSKGSLDDAVRRLGHASLYEDLPHTHLLANARYTTLITNAGTGFSTFGDHALTRWNADRTEDGDGYFVYLRDLDSGEIWSMGHQPLGKRAQRYEVSFHLDRVEIEREDEGIAARMAACVSPDANLELRRCTVRNTSGRSRRIELTSYTEVVLNTRAADLAHPAFSKLFIQTEYLPEQHALLAKRRARSADEAPLCLIHWLIGEGLEPERLQFETDRGRFLGRGRDPTHPLALQSSEPLSGSVGNVLDPIVSLRDVIALEPGAEGTLTFALGAGRTREQVQALAQRHARVADVMRVFERARSYGEQQLYKLRISTARAHEFQRLAGALLYGNPRLRASEQTLFASNGERSVLQKIGVTGRWPLALACIDSADQKETVETLLRAHAFWASKNLAVDVLLLIGASLSTERSIRDAVAVASHTSNGKGAIIICRRNEISRQARKLIEAMAHVVIRGEWPPLGQDAALDSGAARAQDTRRFRPVTELVEQAHGAAAAAASAEDEGLLFDNGYGGFSQDGREYVIRVTSSHRPPLPWTHVVANEALGFVASESGASFTWALNSRENRITPWYNDPISDPQGEALYLRDEQAGVFWSPLPGPVPQHATYTVRYGFGYCRYTHTSQDIEHDVCLFVPRHDPVKITRVRLRNLSDNRRQLSVFAYQRLVLGVAPCETAPLIHTDYDEATGAILARNPFRGEFSARIAFAAVAAPASVGPVRFTTDRTAFIGRNASPARPAALLSQSQLDGRTGAGLDPCMALQVAMELKPGESAERVFVLGETDSEDEVRALVQRYQSRSARDHAFDEVCAFWRDTLSALQIKTPSPAIDLMFNGWLAYQNLSCRLWARSAFYQSGGAFGFRDQLQDAAALVYLIPELTRAQILLHAAHQFEQGDVLHWWHPPAGRGLRTRFSDDLLWLAYVTAFYLKTTADQALLDENVGFIAARPLNAKQDEAYHLPEDSGQSASLYEHCCRALDRSLTQGAHGLPLMGTGDWNDGMNRVGREGRGESVWLGFFIYDILGEFIPICRHRDDHKRVRDYAAYRAHLAEALNDAGWDGAWYRRAYYDDGAPLGSAQNDECQIDTVAQSWAVISGAAPAERIEQALDALEQHLISQQEGLIRLLMPPFDRTTQDPGYIKGYVPGVRENGGQYTHAALWAVKALAEAGRASRATKLLEMLSPVSHARNPEQVALYRVEPYVIAADVYGEPPHIGRGGWTWYTGSAGWMYRVTLESLLGFRLEAGNTLMLQPRIPDTWPKFELRYGLPDGKTTYVISVRNEATGLGTVAAASVDDETLEVEQGALQIPLRQDGGCHYVLVTLD